MMTDQRALIGTGRRSEHVLCCCSVVAVYRLTLYLFPVAAGTEGEQRRGHAVEVYTTVCPRVVI
eukprot:COSAG02_NODE_18044_length_964_cov_1.443931_2_plen_64_part_00